MCYHLFCYHHYNSHEKRFTRYKEKDQVMKKNYLNDSEKNEMFGGLTFDSEFQYYSDSNDAYLTLSLSDPSSGRQLVTAIYSKNKGTVATSADFNSYSEIDSKGNEHPAHPHHRSIELLSSITRFMKYVEETCEASFEDLEEFHVIASEEHQLEITTQESEREKKLANLKDKHPLLPKSIQHTLLEQIEKEEKVTVNLLFVTRLKVQQVEIFKEVSADGQVSYYQSKPNSASSRQIDRERMLELLNKSRRHQD